MTHERDVAEHAHRIIHIRDGKIESDERKRSVSLAMPFSEAVRVAVASLRANKLRSFLTVLGILIGVSSVIAVVAITDGLDRYIAERVLELGTKSFSVQKMPDIITSREQWIEMNKRKDVDARATWSACARGCAAVQRGGRHGRHPRATRSTAAPRQHERPRHGHHRELQPHRLDPRPARPAGTWSRTTSTRRGPWR